MWQIGDPIQEALRMIVLGAHRLHKTEAMLALCSPKKVSPIEAPGFERPAINIISFQRDLGPNQEVVPLGIRLTIFSRGLSTNFLPDHVERRRVNETAAPILHRLAVT